MKVKLPRLPYAANALEPVISAQTILLHHDKQRCSCHDKRKNGVSAGLGRSRCRMVKKKKCNVADILFYKSNYINVKHNYKLCRLMLILKIT